MRCRLSHEEIAYLEAIEEWCRLGSSLWNASMDVRRRSICKSCEQNQRDQTKERNPFVAKAHSFKAASRLLLERRFILRPPIL